MGGGWGGGWGGGGGGVCVRVSARECYLFLQLARALALSLAEFTYRLTDCCFYVYVGVSISEKCYFLKSPSEIRSPKHIFLPSPVSLGLTHPLSPSLYFSLALSPLPPSPLPSLHSPGDAASVAWIPNLALDRPIPALNRRCLGFPKELYRQNMGQFMCMSLRQRAQASV